MEYLYLATVIAVTLIYFYKKYMKIVKTVEHIPGPPIIPFFGNALMFITKDSSSVIAFAEKIVAKYGYFIRILLGPKILIVMSDPDDIESFIVDGKATEKSEDYEYTKAWIGEGLVTSTGQKWFSRRKIITPAFHFGILQSFVNTFDCNGNIFVDKLRNYESVDIFQLVVLYALDNICVTGFHAKQKKLLKTLHGFTDSVIIARRDELIKNMNNNLDNNDTMNTERNNLIDILIQSSIDGRPLSNLDIREEVDTFMFAGHDTVSSASSFALYYLAKYPEIQQKAFEEMRQVFGDDRQRAHTLNDLNELRYLELVIKESLRILPPVPFIGRKLNKNMLVNGKLLPNGANVVIAPLLMATNPLIWKDPRSFIPERFELDNLSTLSPFAYLPFSAGQRNCIGQKYAVLEMKSLISKVLMNFEISIEQGFELRVKAELVLKPTNGIRLRLKDRQF